MSAANGEIANTVYFISVTWPLPDLREDVFNSNPTLSPVSKKLLRMFLGRALARISMLE
jgi:hypothetical protein